MIDKPIKKSARIRLSRLSRRYAGFTLIEIAVVLAIIGFILSGVVGSFTSSIEVSRVRETKQMLVEIKEALLGFAMINARLPCPVLAISTDGEEDIAVLDVPGDPMKGGTCSNQHGYIPTNTLGLKGAVSDKNILLDAWKNPIRYSVDDADDPPGVPTYKFTITDGLQNTTIPPTIPAPPLPPYLVVNNLDAACSQTLITNAVVAIVYSTGKNGLQTATSEGEKENTDDDNDFVLTSFKEDGNGCYYDDMMEWISVNTLYSKLISAGQLP